MGIFIYVSNYRVNMSNNDMTSMQQKLKERNISE